MSVRVNFDDGVEAALNAHISKELQVGFNYSAMASYFGRPDVNLPGMTRWSQDSIKMELSHAQKLTDYLLQRGGRPYLGDVSKPAKTEFGSALEAVEFSVEMEKQTYAAIEQLVKLAESVHDNQTAEFLTDNLLKETLDDLVDCGNVAAGFRRCGQGAGEQQYDKQLLEKRTGCLIM